MIFTRKHVLGAIIAIALFLILYYRYASVPKEAIQEDPIPLEFRKMGINPKCAEVPITLEEVSKHDTCSFKNEKNDAWIAINDYVYDVSEFLLYHPGGEPICSMAGKNATDVFMGIHHEHVITEELPHLCIGKLQ